MKIGVFDSGVGGLWILKNLKESLTSFSYIFIGDQYHVPYGERNLEEIREFSEEITKFLINKGCKIIVIACNTASAASLKYLREKFSETIFVGMEPAVKPAVETTHTKKVGVLATPATFQGELYNSIVEKFANDVLIFKNTCDGLVNQIEKGELDGKETKEILENALNPMIKEGIDTVVLGCTHYPFVMPLIKEIVGENINVIDPTPAIVKQVRRLIDQNGFLTDDNKLEILTTGEVKEMENTVSKLFKDKMDIKKVTWNNLTLE